MGALGFLESWAIHFDTGDHAFLHDSQIFPVIRSLMSRSSANHENEQSDSKKQSIAVFAPTNLTAKAEIKVSTAQHRVEYMVDESTETFWQSAINADNDQFNYNQRHDTSWIQLIFGEAVAIKEVVWALDSDRDKEYMPAQIQVFVGESDKDCELIHTYEMERGFTGWFSIRMAECKSKTNKYDVDTDGTITSKFFWFKVPKIMDGKYELRLRQLIVLGPDVKQEIVPDSYSKKLQRVQDGALDLFRRLVSRTFLPKAIRAAQKAEQKAEIEQMDANDDEDEEEKKGRGDDDDEEEETKEENIDDGIDDSDDLEVSPVAPPKPGLLRQKTAQVQEGMVGMLAFMADQGQSVGNLQRLVFELIFIEIKKGNAQSRAAQSHLF